MRSFRFTLMLVFLLAPPATAAAEAPVYRVVALGDSYASGEGAPDVPGQHNNSGVVTHANVWDAGLAPGSTAFADADHCHRSPEAGAALATRRLADEFPEVDVRFRSFACSGATTLEGILGPYSFRPFDSSGPILPAKVTKPPQVAQARDAFGATPIDAVVMSIGGNDVAFATLVKRCFNIAFVGRCSGNLGRREETLEIFHQGDPKGSGGLDRLNARFDRVADALAARGEERLLAPARRVLLTAVPNLATGDGNAPCDNERPDDNLVDNLDVEESILVRDHIFAPLTAEFARAAGEHGWDFVDGVIGAFAGHGICATDNFVNTNLEAVHRQGEDSGSSGVPGLAVSSGFAHPNYDGYDAYADAILPKLRAELRERFTPAPVRPLPHALERDPATGAPIAVVFRFEGDPRFVAPAGDDPGFASRHQLRLLDPNRLSQPLALVEGEDELRVALPAGTPDRFLVQARACGPLNDGRSCTGFSVPRPVSLVAPPPPSNPSVIPGRPASPLVAGAEAALTVRWQHPTNDPDVRRFEVSASGRAIVHAPGPFRRAAVLTGLADGVEHSVRVIACSDFACSAPASASGPAGTGTFKFAGAESELISPAVGVATIAPRRVRARHTLRVRLSWTHPLNWNNLSEIVLRVRTGERIAGTVTVRPHAPRRKLRAGGAIRSARGRLRTPGPAGRTLTVRLALAPADRLIGRKLTLDARARDRFG